MSQKPLPIVIGLRHICIGRALPGAVNGMLPEKMSPGTFNIYLSSIPRELKFNLEGLLACLLARFLAS